MEDEGELLTDFNENAFVAGRFGDYTCGTCALRHTHFSYKDHKLKYIFMRYYDQFSPHFSIQYIFCINACTHYSILASTFRFIAVQLKSLFTLIEKNAKDE
jgi:hypothetical protein